MKLGEKRLKPPEPTIVTIYRIEDGKPANFDFHCAAVLDMTQFEQLYPKPKPPIITKISTGEKIEDVSDKRYRVQIEKWIAARFDWYVITALRATPGLEWEKVKYDDPTTWEHYEEELRSVLTPGEFDRLMMGVSASNNPSEKTRNEALQSFLATQEVQEQNQSIPSEEAINTQSGEPAKD